MRGLMPRRVDGEPPQTDTLRDKGGDVGPIAPAERLLALDVLRGFAVSGILLANIQIIGGIDTAGATANSGVDGLARGISAVAIDGSFFPLFSLLFGLGLMLQAGRAEQKGASFVPVYLRRLAILMLIALAHWMLVWDAFILINYAALGVPLLLFRRSSGRVLVASAAVLLCLQIAGHPLSRAADRILRNSPVAGVLARQDSDRMINAPRWTEQRVRRLSEGSYVDAVTERAQRFVRTFSRPNRYYPWWYGSIFAMFLLGLWAGRASIVHRTDAHLPLLRKLLWWGLAVGLVGNLAALLMWEWLRPAWGSATYTVAYAFDRVGGPALSFCYAAGLLLLLRRARARRALSVLAPVGRMALSNYLLQSVAATMIFYGHGLALYGKVRLAGGLAIALAIVLIQIAASIWWMSRFRFGPAEWLWRSLTYGALQPLRR